MSITKNFDLYRQQAIALGISDAAEIRTYIREEQEAELKQLLLQREAEKRLALEAEKVQANIEAEKVKARLEAEKVQANIEAEKKMLD